MQDMMDLERVREINRLFTEINKHKDLLKSLPDLKNKYADLVNSIYELSREDSHLGEQLTAQALELGQAIGEALVAPGKITKLEQELTMKYGIPPREVTEAA